MGTLRLGVQTFRLGRLVVGTLGTLIHVLIFEVGTLGTFFRPLIFEYELPPLGLMSHAGSGNSQPQLIYGEDSVPHPSQGLSEAGPLGSFAAIAKRQRRLTAHSQLVQVAGSDLGGAVTHPPKADEYAPGGTFRVGGLVRVVEVAEETGDTGDLQDTADCFGPSLEAADGLAVAGHPGSHPGPSEREAGSHQQRAVPMDPGQQVRVPEALAAPGLVHVCVEPDADHPPGNFVRELRVVSSGDPGAPDG